MGRVVILEGPDGGGKTTLAYELVKHGFSYKHNEPPKAGVDLLADYLCQINDALEDSHNVVFDRLHLGELVYGPICRGIDRIGKEGLKLFERLHHSKPIQQYICMSARKTLEQNHLKKGDYEEETYKKIVHAYKEYCHREWDVYDYEEDKVDRVLMNIDSPAATIDNLPNGTIGSLTGKYLFIGDVPNHPYIDVPFFALNGSSGYLNQALELAAISEKDLVVSNAFNPGSMKHSLEAMVKSLPHLKHIFLMGSRAQVWFFEEKGSRTVDFEVHSLPHPSYLKRFKGHNPQVMADLIKEKL